MHSDESLNIAFSKAMLKIIERGTRFKNDIDDILRNAVVGAAPNVQMPENTEQREWPEFASGHPGAFDAKIRTVLDSHSDRINGVQNMLTDAIGQMANLTYGFNKDGAETEPINTETVITKNTVFSYQVPQINGFFTSCQRSFTCEGLLKSR